MSIKKALNLTNAQIRPHATAKANDASVGKMAVNKPVDSKLNAIPRTKCGYLPKFELRKFQSDAIKHLEQGRNTLVSAPTGSGKTMIAVAAMYRALKSGKNLIYTAPIKALSNQKIDEFKNELARQFLNDPDLEIDEEEAMRQAEQSVGLITGDHSHNRDARIKIMTTEVLNMALFDLVKGKKPPRILENLETIVFDEFHYLNDPGRGHVWEECVINSPNDVQLIGLSATMGNAEQVNNWIKSIKKNKTVLVNEPEKNRPVKLKFFHVEKNKDFDMKAKAMQGDDSLEIKSHAGLEGFGSGLRELEQELERKIEVENTREEVGYLQRLIDRENELMQMTLLVKLLQDNDKLPALVFKFNKGSCDAYAQRLAEIQNDKFQLLNPEEKAELQETVDNAVKEFPYLENELESIEFLKHGIAPHHAGHLPQFKTLVEKLFEKGLIKVVFATSTLAAGINMPARTTVLTELDSQGTGKLSVSEFKQMSGRAGRPGFDTEGNVLVFGEKKKVKSLIDAKPEDIESRLMNKYSNLLNFITAGDDALNKFLSKSLLHYMTVNPTASQKAQLAEEEKLTEVDLLNTYTRMTKVLSDNEYIDAQGKLTDKAQIARRFKFNNPLFITEFLLSLSNDKKALAEVENMRADNFAAIISLLAHDEGHKDFDALNEFLDESKAVSSILVDLLARTYQDSLNHERENNLLANDPCLNYKKFYMNLNWASAGVKKPGVQQEQRFIDIVDEGSPGNDLRNLRQTLNLLKHIRQVCELRESDNPRKTILSPILKAKVNEAIRLVNRGIVKDNSFALSI